MSVFRCGCPIIEGVCVHRCALAGPAMAEPVYWPKRKPPLHLPSSSETEPSNPQGETEP